MGGVRRWLQEGRSEGAAKVPVSRHAGSPQPAEPLTALMSSESGLYHVNRMGLMAQRPTAPTAAPLDHMEIEKGFSNYLLTATRPPISWRQACRVVQT